MRAMLLLALTTLLTVAPDPGDPMPNPYPVTLTWSGAHRVTVTIENPHKKVLKLDGPSVGEGSELSNKLFTVTADGAPIEYQGMMAKRAPPDSFIELQPGKRYSSTIDLAEYYAIPKGAKRVEVTFGHQNHFSPDAVRFESKPLVLLGTPSLPVALTLKSLKATPKGYDYAVHLRLVNSTNASVKLDGPSVLAGGRITNSFFSVTVDGKPVRYEGMLKEREAPTTFIDLAPGAAHDVDVDLTAAYPVQRGAKAGTVTFSSLNDFSPDQVRFESEPLSIAFV